MSLTPTEIADNIKRIVAERTSGQIGCYDQNAWDEVAAHTINEAETIIAALRSHDALVKALDPDTLDAVADEIEAASWHHGARAGSLRGLAKLQRAALALATVPQLDPAGTVGP